MPATLGLDCERRISVPALEVRRAINEALRQEGFQITTDQLTRVEAKRGSMLGTSLLLKKSMPVKAVFEVTAEADGCAVVAHLTDNIRNFGKTWGVNRQYREVLTEIQRHVDLVLGKLDGAAFTSFAEPRFWSRSADISVLEQGNAALAKAGTGAVGIAGKALGGSGDATPSAWKGVDSVTFRSSAGVAVLSLPETQADLGIAVMVVSHPGAMPANLARDVESFAGLVEQRLNAAAGGAAQVEVTDPQRPVLEFLHQQAQIRGELPVRTLHVCRSCRVEKITNPEYAKLAARNEKVRDVMAGVGATITSGGIAPTFWLGQIFKLKRLDPEYVCSRCQGLEADEWLVTFCPSCAELQRDVALRSCPKCNFDFRTKASKATLWSVPSPAVEPASVPAVEAATPDPAATAAGQPAAPSAPPPAEPAPPPPAPPAAPAWPSPDEVPLGQPEIDGTGARVCQVCRRNYPNLWRVVIRTPAGFEERFLCGTTTNCQMPSLARPVQV